MSVPCDCINYRQGCQNENPVDEHQQDFCFTWACEAIRCDCTATNVGSPLLLLSVPRKLAKAFGKLSSLAVREKPIVLPFWENASRMTEVKLSFIYFARRLTLIIPILTAAGALIWGYVLWQRNKQRLLKKAGKTLRGLRKRAGALKQKKDHI